jgi:hypothetical protein
MLKNRQSGTARGKTSRAHKARAAAGNGCVDLLDLLFFGIRTQDGYKIQIMRITGGVLP